MRIFLDARDLINIFNRNEPISPSGLAELFLERGHQLVLTFSVISELIPKDNNSLVVARRFVKLEEDVPHVFLQQHDLPNAEIRRAAAEFLEGCAPTQIDPFLSSFIDMWGSGFDPIFTTDLRRTVRKRRMSFQIDLLLQEAPHIFHWASNEGAAIVRALVVEQSSRRGSGETFRTEVARAIRSAGLSDGFVRLDEFAALLHMNPRIAPGWRLFSVVFDQLVADRCYRPTVNDAWDLANVTMLPYVDLLTLDKNKTELVKRAAARLQRFDPSIEYSGRTFSKVDRLLQSL